MPSRVIRKDYYASLEDGESDVERMYKWHLFAAQLAPGESPPLARFDYVAKSSTPAVWVPTAGTYDRFTRFNLGALDLDSVRDEGFQIIRRKLRETETDRVEFLNKIQLAVQEAIYTGHSFKGREDVRYDQARKRLARARDELDELLRNHRTLKKRSSRSFVNKLLRCGALALLVNVELQIIDRNKEDTSQSTLDTARAGVNELAKAHDWEGTSKDRITPRRAAIYNINQV